MVGYPAMNWLALLLVLSPGLIFLPTMLLVQHIGERRARRDDAHYWRGFRHGAELERSSEVRVQNAVDARKDVRS